MSRKIDHSKQSIMDKSGYNGVLGFGNKPAVIVVDFSVGFTSPRFRVGMEVKRELEQTNRILNVMRSKHFPVVFTTIWYNKNMADVGIWQYKWQTAMDFTDPENCKIDPALNYDPQKDSLVIKKGASAFFETNMRSLLTSMGVDTVIIVGCTTSGGIRASAIDSVMSGFRTIVVEDAVTDRVNISHDVNLFEIQNKYADVMTTNEVLEVLEQY